MLNVAGKMKYMYKIQNVNCEAFKKEIVSIFNLLFTEDLRHSAFQHSFQKYFPYTE